ncbi:hypothetical protein AVEN_274440-1 [Araneus ventricosus]|uniref:Uncharacterized protein n=1 Tax=Araneus ventricosus TaxID=182803 RepID=A0A4Y2F8T5_ARAVE|nr:hypothetical protein AVEN_274440-1 [Araneus ventricosus]
MKIPTGTTISSKAIYFPRLKNRPERIVLRQPRRMHPEKGKKRREGHACGPPLLFSILSIILRLPFKSRRLELARVAVYGRNARLRGASERALCINMKGHTYFPDVQL